MPSHLFFESGDTTNPNGKRSKSGSADKTQDSIEAKNKTLELCVLTETSATISQSIRDLKSEKRKLKNDFIDGVGNKKEARDRIQRYYTSKKNDSLEEDYTEPDSQESYLSDLYHIECEVEEQSQQLKKVRNKLAGNKFEV